MKNSMLRFSVFPLIFLLCLFSGCQKKEEEMAVENQAQGDIRLDEIPLAVMDVLKARFPQPEIQKWTKEQEGEIVVYDIEFEQEGLKYEADISETGAIQNWEKAIGITDLPEAVMKTVKAVYSESTIKEIMEITAVSEGQDVLEGYEIVLETADMKEVEVTVDPGGQILEDSGEVKPEEM